MTGYSDQFYRDFEGTALPSARRIASVDERWPRYWVDLFAARGFHALNILRSEVWSNPQVTWWYKQNLLLFADGDALAQHSKLREAHAAAPKEPIAVAHPERHLDAVRLTRPGLGCWPKMAPDVIRRSLSDSKRAR